MLAPAILPACLTAHDRSRPLSARCGVLSLSKGSAAGQLDIAKAIDAGVEEAGDDGRSLVFDDDGGTADQGARAQLAPLVDRDLDEFAGFSVENRAGARGLGSIWLGCGCDGLALVRTRCGKEHHPAQHFDL